MITELDIIALKNRSLRLYMLIPKIRHYSEIREDKKNHDHPLHTHIKLNIFDDK